MAKEGKKLELYEILAAKRDKGKVPLGLDQKTAKQANTPEPEPEVEVTDRPGVIIDDAVSRDAGFAPVKEPPPAAPPPPPPHPVVEARPEPRERERAPSRREIKPPKVKERPAPVQEHPEPIPEPRPKSPREVVFALDTALFFFFVVLVLVGTSFFIGYKRGLEERPTGLAGLADLEVMDGERLNIRNLSPAPRTTVRPSEQDYTLIIRTEPASDELPERLELELSEALIRGRQLASYDFPGFIFRSSGSEPLYILAVGVAPTINDAGLESLRNLYNSMDGINLSRVPVPYKGCRISPIRELGTPVY